MADQDTQQLESGAKTTPLSKPVTTQEQFDSMVAERINRLKSQYSDYDELKKL